MRFEVLEDRGRRGDGHLVLARPATVDDADAELLHPDDPLGAGSEGKSPADAAFNSLAVSTCWQLPVISWQLVRRSAATAS